MPGRLPGGHPWGPQPTAARAGDAMRISTIRPPQRASLRIWPAPRCYDCFHRRPVPLPEIHSERAGQYADVSFKERPFTQARAICQILQVGR